MNEDDIRLQISSLKTELVAYEMKIGKVQTDANEYIFIVSKKIHPLGRPVQTCQEGV